MIIIWFIGLRKMVDRKWGRCDSDAAGPWQGDVPAVTQWWIIKIMMIGHIHTNVWISTIHLLNGEVMVT